MHYRVWYLSLYYMYGAYAESPDGIEWYNIVPLTM
jgi:hypothetical protein